MTERQGDWIMLEGMQFYGYHGLHKEERKTGQLFVVDLHLQADLAPAGAADELAATVNYEQVFTAVREIVEGRQFRLIEALAETIAAYLLATYPLQEVMVRVQKPQAPLPGRFRHVGVEIRRRPPAFLPGAGRARHRPDAAAAPGPVTAYLGLGSNLGDRLGYLLRAAAALSNAAVRLQAVSAVYETAPWGRPEQPAFLNAVVQVATTLDAHTLLARALQVEADLGRQRSLRWGPRTIDIDLLLFGTQRIDAGPDLVVPHPRLGERAFVLVPLYDLAPELVLPGGVSLREALARVDRTGVVPHTSGAEFEALLGATR